MKIEVILVLCITRFFQKPGTLSNPNIFEWFKFIYSTFEVLEFFGENQFFLNQDFFFSRHTPCFADISLYIYRENFIFFFDIFEPIWMKIFSQFRLVQYWLNNLGWNIRDYLCWIVIIVCGFFLFFDGINIFNNL